MDLSKFNNLSQFIKNLMNSYNNTLIIKIGISDNYDTSYLFNNIIMKYGGNYVLCDTNREKIEEIKKVSRPPQIYETLLTEIDKKLKDENLIKLNKLLYDFLRINIFDYKF